MSDAANPDGIAGEAAYGNIVCFPSETGMTKEPPRDRHFRQASPRDPNRFSDPMQNSTKTLQPRPLYILSGIYDDLYLSCRNDSPPLCTSAGKRKMLYAAIAAATSCIPTILSPQPRGHLAPSEQPTRDLEFAGLPQKFCRASGMRKIRILRDMVHYAKHVYQHSKNGALFVVDNYELIYAVALCYCRLRGRLFTVVIDYEDGKHLIDRGLMRLLSSLAEFLIKPMVKGAILATPTLAERLPLWIPNVVVPGILSDDLPIPRSPSPSGLVHLLYSGSLDVERGIPLLLEFLISKLIPPGICVEVTGQGRYTDELEAISKRMPDQVRYHGKVSESQLLEIRNRCHLGLNLQSSADPISQVTYPSKTFDYLNAGLRLVSTKAAGVEGILGPAAIYLEHETTAGLAKAIVQAASDCRSSSWQDLTILKSDYSLSGTIRRLAGLFGRITNYN